MKLLIAVLALVLALAPCAAQEQVRGRAVPESAPAAQQATATNSAVVEKGVSTATITVPASTEPQEFKIDLKPLIDGLVPYIVAAVGGVITVLGGLLTLWLKQKFNIDVDAKYREAWQQSATNAAGDLIARGAVKIEQATGRLVIENKDMATVINTVIARVPDAVKHFGLTPDDIRTTVIAKVPQVLTGATPAAPVGKV